MIAVVATQVWAAGGDLDHSFSSDGRTRIAFGDGDDVARAVAIQKDGKILVAGQSLQGPTRGYQFAVARFKSDGSLDHSFSGDGRRRVGFGNGEGSDFGTGIAIQADGKIVIVGTSTRPAGFSDVAVARLNANGSLDHGFSTDGRATVGFRPSSDEFGSGVAIQANGKIVVAGTTDARQSLSSGFAVLRFNGGGKLDRGFSGDGRATIRFRDVDNEDAGTAVAIQRDGKLVVAGRSSQGARGEDFAVARLNASGRLDNGFSDDGRRTTAFTNGGRDDVPESVVIDPRGRIVVAGSSDQPAGGMDFAASRYGPNGDLDHTFSEDGRFTTGFGTASFDQASGVAIQRNGKIVVAGSSDQSCNCIRGLDFAVARLRMNGSLDQNFSDDGRTTAEFGNRQIDFADGVAIQQNGAIVLAGGSEPNPIGPESDFAVARFLSK